MALMNLFDLNVVIKSVLLYLDLFLVTGLLEKYFTELHKIPNSRYNYVIINVLSYIVLHFTFVAVHFYQLNLYMKEERCDHHNKWKKHDVTGVNAQQRISLFTV